MAVATAELLPTGAACFVAGLSIGWCIWSRSTATAGAPLALTPRALPPVTYERRKLSAGLKLPSGVQKIPSMEEMMTDPGARPNKLELPVGVREDVAARRGAEHCFAATLNPKKTALLVVDMQHCFLTDGAGHFLVKQARAVAPAINRIAAALRPAGGKVVWIQGLYTKECDSAWSVVHGPDSKLLATPAERQLRVEALTPGYIGHEVWDGMDVQECDLVCKKQRYSAFIQGSSDLHNQLQAHGIETLVVCGTATNVCCDSTARDGMMLDYQVIMVEDGCAAGSDEEHSAALLNFLLLFGDIMTADEVVSTIQTRTTTGH